MIETVTLPAGTVLWHGTAQEWGFRMPGWRSFFSRHRGVARHFARLHAGWTGKVFPGRVQKYVVTRDLTLPVIRNHGTDEVWTKQEWSEFRRHLGFPEDGAALRDTLCAYYEGWLVEDNYGPGADDIFLCRPERWLRRVQAKGDRFAGLGGTFEEWQRADRNVDESLFPWNTEVVDIDFMLRAREYDRMREKSFTGRRGSHNVAILESWLRYEGFRQSLFLVYYRDTRSVVLGEGNHRVVAAARLGFRGIPVRVIVYRNYAQNLYRDFDPVPAPDDPPLKPDGSGYVPSDIRPSDIGILARPLTARERKDGVQP